MRALFGLGLAIILLCGGCAEDSEPTRPIDFLPLTQITIESQYPQIATLTTNQFRAVGHFSGVFTRDITDEVLWSVDNEAVLQIGNAPENSGLATALAPGTLSVAATLDGIAGEIDFTVTEAVISSISVSPAAAQVPVGLTLPFTATGTFSDGTVQDLTSLASWGSGDETVATIASSGVATAVAVGTAPITAIFQDVAGEAQLTVTGAVLVSLALEPAGEAALVPGETLQIVARGAYSDGTSQVLTNDVLWNSSVVSVATVSQGGLVEAVAPGEATITAEREGFTAQLVISVPVIESIAVAPSGGGAATVAVGGTLQLIATGNFAGNLSRDITSQASWSTLQPSIATVGNEAGNRGRVTGQFPGTATIRATRNGLSRDIQVTVQ